MARKLQELVEGVSEEFATGTRRYLIGTETKYGIRWIRSFKQRLTSTLCILYDSTSPAQSIEHLNYLSKE